jgi:hypothetical protein
MPPIDPLTRFISPGEPVSAGVANRPTRDIDAAVRYLYDLIETLQTGAVIFADNLTVEAGALPGMPVYWNAATQRFERALAAVVSDPVTGRLRAADSAQVWGVVRQKASATLARILFAGYDNFDITAATGSPTVAGVYYLSAATPGALTAVRPAFAVPVLRADGDGGVLVEPQFADPGSGHQHYQAELLCRPAGHHTPPVPGERHVITSPDATKRGWLPASHVSFGGLAPAMARFGYNLAADPTLLALWPPVPLDGVSLEWNRGGDYTKGAQGVPLGLEGQCVIDRNGIWWLSDCYQDVPWPSWLDTSVPDPESTESAESIAGHLTHCPREVDMELVLWFTRVDFLSDGAAVTSLTTRDARVKIVCPGTGTPASAGPLEIDLNLTNVVAPGLNRGSTVLKTLDPDGQTFRAGRVAEGLYALGSNVTLSSDQPTMPLNPSIPLGTQVYQGLVQLSVSTQPTLELPVLLVRLHGAEEEFQKGAMFIGLDADAASSFVAKFHVPADLQIASPKLAFRFTLLGRASGTLPAISLVYQIVARPPSGLSTPLTLTAGTTSLALTDTVALTPDQYVEATSATVNVNPGDTVFLTVSRGAPDGYSGQVGVLELVGVLTPGV